VRHAKLKTICENLVEAAMKAVWGWDNPEILMGVICESKGVSLQNNEMNSSEKTGYL
jgi:hypothetical protein